MRAAEFHVVGRIGFDRDELVIRNLATHLCRNACHERARRDSSALQHDRATGHQGAGPDNCTVHDGRAHADQAVVLDRATVHNGTVADAHA